MIPASQAILKHFRVVADRASLNSDLGCEEEFNWDLISTGGLRKDVKSFEASCVDPESMTYSCWDTRKVLPNPRHVRSVAGLVSVCKADEYCKEYLDLAYAPDPAKDYPPNTKKAECRPKAELPKEVVGVGKTVCKQTPKVAQKFSKLIAFISKKNPSKSGSSSGGPKASDTVPGSVLRVTEITQSGQFLNVATTGSEILESTNVGSIYRVCAAIPGLAVVGILSYALETNTSM